MKDLFSAQAKDYLRFRPQYPRELFEFFGSVSAQKSLAWDCATGNGQAAIGLAEFFDNVIGTDISEKQLSEAIPHPQVLYRVASAEESGLQEKSVDLITVAQAFHWFDHQKFYTEVKRVGRDGHVAIWGYSLAQFSKTIDEVVLDYYNNTLSGYWEPERKLVEDRYETIPFPFELVPHPEFEMTSAWTLDHLVGYLRTWSATQAKLKATKKDPVLDIEAKLRKVWGKPSTEHPVYWKIFLKIGKI